ncbi:hypothetical protein ACUNTN_003706, partial [Vibrio cholerae]
LLYEFFMLSFLATLFTKSITHFNTNRFLYKTEYINIFSCAKESELSKNSQAIEFIDVYTDES